MDGGIAALRLGDRLRVLSEAEREEFLSRLSDDEAAALLYDWQEVVARKEQLPPADYWQIWLLLAGRGFGKTRTGAEWVRSRVESDAAKRIALVAPTASDARDVMVEGESGILAISRPDFRPLFEPSKRRLTWPNGAIATTYSADEPQRLRGPQHDAAWCDELAAWRYAEAWDMLMLGLRLGTDPRCIITTTPKPIKIIRDLIARSDDPSDVRITRGKTYDNRANLAITFLQQILRKYEGTRLGRQEINAELLDDVAGALWNRKLIDDLRLRRLPDDPKFRLVRVVVSIDPAASANEDSDETGIICAALGSDGHGYILDDESGRYMPPDWAGKALKLYDAHRADRIVAEVNNGGAMVEHTIRVMKPSVSYKAVHASRGKVTRAEPVAALYEKQMVHHLGAFPTLEDQMCSFTGDLDRKKMGSPDRVDALVWALTELMVDATIVSTKPLRL
ncbi:MAG TPA: terminase family protein [Beijerinckiaceae bacterium]|jgi:predicted phage terminase large subunit-like protein|nr:terminase family protein [Beijerinckiaceae bacterium]